MPVAFPALPLTAGMRFGFDAILSGRSVVVLRGDFSFADRQLIHVLDQLNVTGALWNFPPSEHPLLRIDHDFGWQGCSLAKQSGIIDKAGDVGGGKTVQHAACTNDLAREDAGVDCCLAVVAHDAA